MESAGRSGPRTVSRALGNDSIMNEAAFDAECDLLDPRCRRSHVTGRSSTRRRASRPRRRPRPDDSRKPLSVPPGQSGSRSLSPSRSSRWFLTLTRISRPLTYSTPAQRKRPEGRCGADRLQPRHPFISDPVGGARQPVMIYRRASVRAMKILPAGARPPPRAVRHAVQPSQVEVALPSARPGGQLRRSGIM